MDLNHDLNHVVESLTTKLADVEQRASQFEAVAIAKDIKIQELESKMEELKNKNEGKEVK